MYDVGYDVPTSWHGSVCPVYVAWFSRALSFLRKPRLISCSLCNVFLSRISWV